MSEIGLYLLIPLAAALINLTPAAAGGRRAGAVALAASLGGLAVSLALFNRELAGVVGGVVLFVDGLSALVLVLVQFLVVAVVLYSLSWADELPARGRYFSLLMLMNLGMNGVLIAGDLLTMFIFIELAAVSAYVLVGFKRGEEEREASFKYLVQGTISSLSILTAVGLFAMQAGTFFIRQMGDLRWGPAGFLSYLAFALFLFGFSLKSSLIPFHAWLPDAHPAAPAPVSAFCSGMLIKVIGIYALLRVFFAGLQFSPAVAHFLLGAGSASILVGVLLALGQWDLKRLLAYHTISQMGYIAMAIGLGTPLGMAAALFHLANHAVFKTLLFFVAGALERAAGTRRLKEMGGLRNELGELYAVSATASFSIAGLPPFNGFWSKLLIVIACLRAGYPTLAVVAVAGAILTLASFAKVQRYAFGGARSRDGKPRSIPATMRLAMAVLAGVCVVGGALYLPGPRRVLTRAARAAMYQDTVIPFETTAEESDEVSQTP